MFWIAIKPGDAPPAQLKKDPEIVDLPPGAMLEACAINVLNEGLGFRKSSGENPTMLGDGRLIPMMAYGLVEYVMGLDLSGMDVLELGGGDSTDFWSRRTRSVLTFETDAKWAGALRERGLGNVEVRAVRFESSHTDIAALDRKFDIIAVDIGGSRYKCARAARPLLAENGFMILDNADWYPNTAALLRDSGLIQVDFHDFRPRHYTRGATSLFLSPGFRPKPLGKRLPAVSIGGTDLAAENRWDYP